MPTTKVLKEIVLSEFLECALGSTLSHLTIPPNVAAQIAEVDKDEQYCHVEFPNADNELSRPVLWRIDDWKTSHTRYIRRKGFNERQRAIEVHASETRAKFIKALMSATGCSEAQCAIIAVAVIKTRQSDLAGIYGIDITELLKADDELIKFKQENGMK